MIVRHTSKFLRLEEDEQCIGTTTMSVSHKTTLEKEKRAVYAVIELGESPKVIYEVPEVMVVIESHPDCDKDTIKLDILEVI